MKTLKLDKIFLAGLVSSALLPLPAMSGRFSEQVSKLPPGSPPIVQRSVLPASNLDISDKYTFVKLADSYSAGTPYAELSLEWEAVLNDSAEVAFRAKLKSNGKSGIFLMSGVKTTPIFKETKESTDFGAMSINDKRTVSFWASHAGDIPYTAVYATKPGSTAVDKVADSLTPPFANIAREYTSINKTGNVVFGAELNKNTRKGSGEFIGNTNYTADIADSINRGDIANKNGPFVNFLQTGFSGSVGPAVNNGDKVAFWAQLNKLLPPDDPAWTIICGGDPSCYPGYVVGVFLASPTGIKMIADTRGEYLNFASQMDMNDAGTIAYMFRGDGNNNDTDGSLALRGINLYKSGWFGAKSTLYVDNNGDYSRFGAVNINNKGQLAFLATLDPAADFSTLGIFTGPNPETDTLVKIGDTLDGKTVSMVSCCFANKAINNNGQIVFTVQFDDNSTALYRADPL